jgi:hypothetical protein
MDTTRAPHTCIADCGNHVSVDGDICWDCEFEIDATGYCVVRFGADDLPRLDADGFVITEEN